MNKPQKISALFLALILALAPLASLAEAASSQDSPPPMPAEGQNPGTPPDGEPPAMPEGQNPGNASGGTPPSMPDGQNPGNPPDGMPGGGQAGQPDGYSAVMTIEEDTSLSGEAVASTGADENAILITGGTLTLTDGMITRDSAESTGGDSASFYGVGAAVLVTGGTATLTGGTISTDAKGGAGVFAYGAGVANVSDMTITTMQSTSGGIHVAGGGTLHASNLTVETYGESSAAIRSDRGSGTMVVDGGSYIAHGSGSPAVYVTADITIKDATLTATGSEALCLEGLNSVRLTDCRLYGAMPDLEQNDNTWTVILYQSMSGDSTVGEGYFEMNGGTLSSENGGLFYTTNTESTFLLNDVEIITSEDCEYFLRCTGNRNQRGWGAAGANGADCTFIAMKQRMDGDILWDSISHLRLTLKEGSVLTGAVIDDESCAGDGGSGTCTVTIDATSTWVVTGDSRVTTLACEGSLVDTAGLSVTVQGIDGTVYRQGDSAYTVTVDHASF